MCDMYEFLGYTLAEGVGAKLRRHQKDVWASLHIFPLG
jgi:hypothetical protein